MFAAAIFIMQTFDSRHQRIQLISRLSAGFCRYRVFSADIIFAFDFKYSLIALFTLAIAKINAQMLFP